MLSRLSLRSGALGMRLSHTTAGKQQAAAQVPAAAGSEERDLVNFPRPKRPIDPAPVRMGFIPDAWFRMLYPKTGVTGPYVLGTGLITFLCSKEIYVIEHEFFNLLIFGLMGFIAIKQLGPKVAASLDAAIEKEKEAMNAGRNATISSLQEGIVNDEQSCEEAKGQTILFDAKRENVGLQLEAAYRERLQEVHQEVKKRLDYQLEVSNVKSKFEQRHMVDWIVGNVRKSITPAQEAASLKQCITDLKALAAKA